MKKILYLSFYFEPDLCAGSFRNTPLAKELSRQAGDSCEIVVITTEPNRYNTFKVNAPLLERSGNTTIHRITIPEHKSGFADQIRSFYAYYKGTRRIVKEEKYDLVFASSSRLFTAYLGYRIAKAKKSMLYLDIRDIFTDTMEDVIRNPVLKFFILPVLKFIEKRTFSYARHINLISEGFIPYFKKYPRANYSSFSNGIDDEFIKRDTVDAQTTRSAGSARTILYAGNIGEGQGLHIVIPEAAKKLGVSYEFLVIGDGGAKLKLSNEIKKLQLQNVKLIDPMKRADLIKLYDECDFFFMHLNNYEAFKKVLPSKIFELAAYNKPIIAGVSGYAKQFLEEHVSNTIVFEPGDVADFVKKMLDYKYHTEQRVLFIDKFKRSNLNQKMVESIISYLHQ